MQGCLELLSSSPAHRSVMPLKLWFCLGSKQEPSFFLLVKFPVEHGRQGQCLGLRRVQRMMEQVIESSVTKPGPAPVAPGKVSHNPLRELLQRDFTLFPDSCSLMPTKHKWLKTLCLMLEEGKKAMTLDLHVLGPAFFIFTVSTQDYWRTRLQHMVLRVTVLLAVHFSASLGTSTTPVLPLCTFISMSA